MAAMASPASCLPTPKRSGCFTWSPGVDVGFLVTATPIVFAYSLNEPHRTSARQTSMLYPHLTRGMHTRGRPSSSFIYRNAYWGRQAKLNCQQKSWPRPAFQPLSTDGRDRPPFAPLNLSAGSCQFKEWPGHLGRMRGHPVD